MKRRVAPTLAHAHFKPARKAFFIEQMLVTCIVKIQIAQSRTTISVVPRKDVATPMHAPAVTFTEIWPTKPIVKVIHALMLTETHAAMSWVDVAPMWHQRDLFLKWTPGTLNA
jgi:hypothetical protein